MTTAAIRNRLMNYLEEADPKKLKALYTLLEDELNSGVALTDEQLRILDEERVAYQNGQGRSYTWDEAKEVIRGK